MDLKSFIRDVVDFPIEGVVFKDICPLLQDPDAFQYAIDSMIAQLRDSSFDVIAAPDARGCSWGLQPAATTCILIRRLQVLEPLVLRYARSGARRDRARRLPNRTEL